MKAIGVIGIIIWLGNINMNEFNDDKLNNLIENSQKIIDKRIKELNAISNDIKNLEEFLQKNFGGIVFELNLTFEVSLIYDKRLKYLCYSMDRQKILMDRPLIECPLEVRLVVRHRLPDFLKAISEHIAEMNTEEEPEEQDCDCSNGCMDCQGMSWRDFA